MKAKIAVLVIMSRDGRLPLLLGLEECGIDAFPANDRAEAKSILESHWPLQAVLTDTILPDGTWRDVLEDVARSGTRAEVIVSARVADARLWCDVLEGGAYDLLVEPYHTEEVRRIIEGAVSRSSRRLLPPVKEKERAGNSRTWTKWRKHGA